VRLIKIQGIMKILKFRALDKAEKVMISADEFYLDSGLESPLWKILKDLQKDFLLIQFTGLFDVNGVEIYEGDLVKRIVVNGHNKETIERTFTVELGKTELLPFNKFSSDDLWEVVGSIYEDKGDLK
jgi:uncharacterized phage protein (TIGR01671 family)